MSTLPPECEQLLIAGYILGNLSPVEALLFQEMLAENPELNQQILAMQEALDLVYAPPEISPPATLRDRILAAANTEATAQLSDKSENYVTAKASLPWNKILWAIAGTIITILGIANYRLWQSLETANTIEHTSKQLTYLLNSQDSSQQSTAKLIVNLEGLTATLRAENLPPLPPDKVYALWTVVGKDVAYTTDEKGAILTAVFQVNESGDFNQEITVPQPYLKPKIIDKIAISIEDISAPQAHRGSIFISTTDQ